MERLLQLLLLLFLKYKVWCMLQTTVQQLQPLHSYIKKSWIYFIFKAVIIPLDFSVWIDIFHRIQDCAVLWQMFHLFAAVKIKVLVNSWFLCRFIKACKLILKCSIVKALDTFQDTSSHIQPLNDRLESPITRSIDYILTYLF